MHQIASVNRTLDTVKYARRLLLTNADTATRKVTDKSSFHCDARFWFQPTPVLHKTVQMRIPSDYVLHG